MHSGDYQYVTWQGPAVNGTTNTNSSLIGNNGFSILGFNGEDWGAINLSTSNPGKAGSVIIGTYYQMPHFM